VGENFFIGRNRGGLNKENLNLVKKMPPTLAQLRENKGSQRGSCEKKPIQRTINGDWTERRKLNRGTLLNAGDLRRKNSVRAIGRAN